MNRTLDEALGYACNNIYIALTGDVTIITPADGPLIRERIEAGLATWGWPDVDSVDVRFHDEEEGVTVAVQHGLAKAERFLRFEDADGCLRAVVDTDSSGD